VVGAAVGTGGGATVVGAAVTEGRATGAGFGRACRRLRRFGRGVRVGFGLAVAEGASSAPALGGSAESPTRWVVSELAA
jgi:hypothetical protein